MTEYTGFFRRGAVFDHLRDRRRGEAGDVQRLHGGPKNMVEGRTHLTETNIHHAEQLFDRGHARAAGAADVAVSDLAPVGFDFDVKFALWLQSVRQISHKPAGRIVKAIFDKFLQHILTIDFDRGGHIEHGAARAGADSQFADFLPAWRVASRQAPGRSGRT